MHIERLTAVAGKYVLEASACRRVEFHTKIDGVDFPHYRAWPKGVDGYLVLPASAFVAYWKN